MPAQSTWYMNRPATMWRTAAQLRGRVMERSQILPMAAEGANFTHRRVTLSKVDMSSTPIPMARFCPMGKREAPEVPVPKPIRSRCEAAGGLTAESQ